LSRLRRGLYELSYPEPAVLPDLWVANRLYEPSYVSLETALSLHQLVPETAAQVTSVTTKATRRFTTPHGLFTYSTVRPAAFGGYGLRRLQGREVRIAGPEKALVDRLYFGLRRGESLESLREERWDLPRLRGLKRAELAACARRYGFYKTRLEARCDALLR
jgi:predicted transcriptional regulator of viral defense system